MIQFFYPDDYFVKHWGKNLLTCNSNIVVSFLEAWKMQLFLLQMKMRWFFSRAPTSFSVSSSLHLSYNYCQKDKIKKTYTCAIKDERKTNSTNHFLDRLWKQYAHPSRLYLVSSLSKHNQNWWKMSKVNERRKNNIMTNVLLCSCLANLIIFSTSMTTET